MSCRRNLDKRSHRKDSDEQKNRNLLCVSKDFLHLITYYIKCR
nr:MAG TPA: hypothetical protein [Caudoviricetes sp.]